MKHFELSLDKSARLLRTTMRGFWDVAVVRQYERALWPKLRELAARAPHFDATTFHMMNAVLAGVTDVITQGKREGAFRDVDPLLAHLTIMPPILIFFARQRVLAGRKLRGGLAEPRHLDQFVRHMQASARGMLRKPS